MIVIKVFFVFSSMESIIIIDIKYKLLLIISVLKRFFNVMAFLI